MKLPLICLSILVAGMAQADVLDPALGTTFPAETANELTRQCGSRTMPPPSKITWLPAPDQIEVLETELAPFLAAKLEARGLDGPRWSVANYHRQYGGLMVGDRLVVYVNGFHQEVIKHRKPTDAWKREVIGICDGGEFAFGVEYDPNWGTFENFHFNGGP